MNIRTPMISVLSLAVLLGLSESPSTAASRPNRGASILNSQSASEAITGLVADQQAAWNVGDAKAFSASFAKDGSFTNVRGQLMYGHTAFENRHREIFSTFFKDSSIQMTVTKLSFIRSDVAIVDVYTVIDKLLGRAPPGLTLSSDGTLKTRLQEVFVRNHGTWQVTSYHNVDIKGS